MFSGKSITKAYNSAIKFNFDDNSKIFIMSDCHRGYGSWADDFAKNQLTCHAALTNYYKQGYTYIELGDGDELWENRSFDEIASTHSDIFKLIEQFYKEKRFYMLYGNHDIEKKFKPELLAHLFPGITVYPAIRLKYKTTGKEMFLVHGHQADFFNNELWRLSRFLVRHIWKPMEMIGYSNPTSAARNNKVQQKVEKRLMEWAEKKKIPLLAGHTHRPVFPEPGAGKYFNDGSCVHPWNITAMEIAGGSITLVKWGQKTRDDGTVYIGKDIIAGPRPLKDYLA